MRVIILNELQRAIRRIRQCKDRLTAQQMKTLKGQCIAGDISGAMKGLENILKNN